MRIMSIRQAKAMLVMLLIVACSYSFFGCSGYDPWYGKKPCDYRPSVWICSSPEMVLTVIETGESTIQIGEAVFRCGFMPGKDFEIGSRINEPPNVNGPLFCAECSFSPEQCVMSVLEDQLFPDSLKGKTLVFAKSD